MKTRLAVAALLLCTLFLVCFFGITRRVTYMSEETGSRRGAEYRAGFIQIRSWKEPSWIENRARNMGIMPSHQTWRKVQDTHTTFIMVSRGHEKAPASYSIGSLPELLNDYTPDIQDQFVREFINASEPEREKLSRQFSHGEYRQ